MSKFRLLRKLFPFKNSLTWISVCVLSFIWSCGQSSSKSAAPEVGYFYSIVFDDVQKKAQYSSVYFSECEVTVLQQKTKDYAKSNNYNDFKVEGKYADTETAEKAKTASKKQFEASGYAIGGDNNFIGDCNP